MNITIVDSDKGGRLIFDGSLTLKFSAQLEAGIINAMRRYPQLQVDLSGVREIDQRGIRLLGLLLSVGGKEVDIVATSPVVEQASERFPVFRRGVDLPRAAWAEDACAS